MVQLLQTYGSIGFISVDKITHGKMYLYVLFHNHDSMLTGWPHFLSVDSFRQLRKDKFGWDVDKPDEDVARKGQECWYFNPGR